MRLFGSDRLMGMVEALGLEEDQPIEHKMLSNAIENAQKRVESRNFAIRKSVLEYDDVMNKQREVIYAQRRKVLNGENLKENIVKMMENIADYIVNLFCSENPHPDFWDWEGIRSYTEKAYVPEGTLDFSKEQMEDLNKEKLRQIILDSMLKRYEEKEKEFGSELMRELDLQNKYPDVEIGLSLPRIRPHPCGSFVPDCKVEDRDLVQIMIAYRLFMPRAGIAISTRERESLRNNLIGLGVTKMSAASSTEVGGHTLGDKSDGQFDVNDRRGVEEMRQMIYSKGYQPVFKDWQAI